MSQYGSWNHTTAKTLKHKSCNNREDDKHDWNRMNRGLEFFLPLVYYHYYWRNELLTEICHLTINCQQTVMFTEHTRGSFYVEYYWGLPWLFALWGPLKSLLFFYQAAFFFCLFLAFTLIFPTGRKCSSFLCFHTELEPSALCPCLHASSQHYVWPAADHLTKSQKSLGNSSPLYFVTNRGVF